MSKLNVPCMNSIFHHMQYNNVTKYQTYRNWRIVAHGYYFYQYEVDENISRYIKSVINYNVYKQLQTIETSRDLNYLKY